MSTPTLLPAPASRPPARPLIRHLVALPDVAQPPLPLEAQTPPGAQSDEVPPDVERAARAVTVAVVEVLAGRRALVQLGNLADAHLLRMIRALTASRALAGHSLRSLRVQAPAPGVAEVAFRVEGASGSRGGALRAHRGPRGWQCVVLEVAATPRTVTRSPRRRERVAGVGHPL